MPPKCPEPEVYRRRDTYDAEVAEGDAPSSHDVVWALGLSPPRIVLVQEVAF